MVVVAGIDEAGLGPVLGPLVVSAVAFELPRDFPEVTLWDLLGGAVSRKPARRGGKIAIGDSKKLFSRRKPNPLMHLERGVLGVLEWGGIRPRSLRELLGVVAPEAGGQLDQYPWYRGADLPLPRCITPTDLTLSGNSLRAAARESGVRLASIRCEPMFVGQLNRHMAATNNKSTTLFDVTGRLLHWLWTNSPPGRIRIVVDRQGGRIRYLAALQRVFEGCSFKVLDEGASLSAYRITDPHRDGQIAFITGAESRRLAAGLASMVSKYLRELFMEMLNRFWIDRIPDLAPTAGYYNDGRRFFQEIGPEVRRMGIGEQLLYRDR